MPSDRLADGLHGRRGASHDSGRTIVAADRPSLDCGGHLVIRFAAIGCKCFRRIVEFVLFSQFPWTLALVRAGAPGIPGRFDAAMRVAIGADHFLIALRIGPSPARLLRTAAGQKTGNQQARNSAVFHCLIPFDRFLNCVMLSPVRILTSGATGVIKRHNWARGNSSCAGNTGAESPRNPLAADAITFPPAWLLSWTVVSLLPRSRCQAGQVRICLRPGCRE